ncbi:MAG: hypothetical protein DCC43_15345 [Candidatus Brocadia sp.]|nr:hypothetical protein [Anaerolineales bacterium]MCE7911909.1 hypothetical protein [Candidatus Brocadia sp. AMX3]MDG5996931.1 hypothetical protein [Candidatus Brocadia sp.]RIJ89457.1 MAG: hypothetical protein DCC43_15345 [Candidatus Brocadia sp.]
MRYFFAAIIYLGLSTLYCSAVFADVSYADLFLTGKGYKPCEDSLSITPLIPSVPPGAGIPDNPKYKKWCTETFHDGEHIYEAYKKIAFDIDYRSEPPKTDYWQTPTETRQRKRGDCEDSVFLFFSELSELNIDGDIVWGWVINKDESISFAHVWYQLFDKRGRLFIVEGFSKEWNGIIPVEMLPSREERIQTLSIRHNKVHCFADEAMPGFTEPFEGEEIPWALSLCNNTVVKEICQKLHDLFMRSKG